MTTTKRRFWQLHLSTLIVLMVELGGLIPLNINLYHHWKSPPVL